MPPVSHLVAFALLTVLGNAAGQSLQVVGVANPKSIVLFVAALPQFLDKPTGHPTAQLLSLGLVFPCIAVVSDSVWAVGAGSARTWFARSPGGCPQSAGSAASR